MEKPATTETPIHELLRRRWSPRAFDARDVEPDKLRALFEAARWAPSCFNEQPWGFIVATREQPAEYARLLACLTDGNIAWARSAPVLMLTVAKRHFDHNGKPNRHALHDVGLAAENLVIQAMALGLHAHQMAGFHVDRVRAEYRIPASHEPATAIAVGYIGDPAQLPEEVAKKERAPRSRRPLPDMVFSGAFGRAHPLVAGATADDRAS